MSEQPSQNNTLLELHVPDFAKVKEFYGKLGFKVVWERKPEGFKGYLVLKMSNNILCFWAGNKKSGSMNISSSFPRIHREATV